MRMGFSSEAESMLIVIPLLLRRCRSAVRAAEGSVHLGGDDLFVSFVETKSSRSQTDAERILFQPEYDSVESKEKKNVPRRGWDSNPRGQSPLD